MCEHKWLGYRRARLHIIPSKVSDKITTPAASGLGRHKMCYAKIPPSQQQRRNPQQFKAPNHNTHKLNLLGERPPLDRQDDAVLAPDSDGGRALPDGLHGVLDLEEVAVGAEDGDGAIVAHLDGSWEMLFSGRWWAYGASGLGERCGHATAATKNDEPMVSFLAFLAHPFASIFPI